MVREFGMSPRLGPVGFGSGSPMYLGDQPVRTRDYAEVTQGLIDEEVERLLKEAEERASQLLTAHRDALDRIVELLLEKETIDGDELRSALGEPAVVDVSASPGEALSHLTATDEEIPSL
jgi:cell division protease FtsH